MVERPKAGRLPEVLFDKKVRSLAEGDQYLDQAELAKELKSMVGGHNVTEKSFFPPKVSKRRCGPPAPVLLLATGWLAASRTAVPAPSW